MTNSILKSRMSGSKLDTKYTSFEAEKSVRSPRTPIYVPDSPSLQAVPPFDHVRIFAEPAANQHAKPSIPPPPNDKPMAWLWICHLCHSRYALGVTRRCLVDGHYYCSGESDKPSGRKKKKHKACSSEFDYAAWTVWGEWRRKALRALQNDRVFKGCENCDFPSQCRYPVDTHPLGDVATATVSPKVPEAEPPKEKRKAEEEKHKSKSTVNEKVDFDQILQSLFPDADSVGLDTPTTKPKKTGSKKKRSSSKSPVPSLELDFSPNDSLHDLVEMDWSNFEEIELGKSKID
ncbi:hypothetical protein H2200_004242 [Cladophialophora chaetospira]|uniref:Uncharacterized protein n=1 Tax=Cladophialophora chaetospira TaxID=386627 RepID=A0AA38XFR7_9EURO|nr:hypothetical protein H2200_004242 [Cladophialophora chaetospira]